MKKAKITKSKNKQDITSNDIIEMYSFQKIFKIFIILILIFIIFYVITNLLIKNKHTSEDNYTAVIDSTKIILNQLLNRKEEEYYVIATQPSKYKSLYIETDYINFYNNYINKYLQQEDALQFYFVDLDSALNKKYLANELNITEDINKLKINGEILFKIKKGKIEKTYVGKDKILDKLSRL